MIAKYYTTAWLTSLVEALPNQDEDKNPVAQRAARGTIKADILEGDPGCPNLITSSVYETNPVHYLSMVSESIQWGEKEKMV